MGAVVLVLLLVLVGSGMSQVVPSQSPCHGGASPHSLEQPEYEKSVRPVGDFMASFVQSFLNTVQPSPFPKVVHVFMSLFVFFNMLNDFYIAHNNKLHLFLKDWTIKCSVLVYEIGFLVCVAFGILYIVLMPIVGLFLACCRCCGKCGGKMHQKQTSSIHCRRRTLYWTTFVTTVIILAGNVCMFRSNEALKGSVDSSKVELNKAINNIQTFLMAVPQFESTFTPALQSLVSLDKEVVNTSALLIKLNTSLTNLESSAVMVQGNITAVKNQINKTLSRAECINCSGLKPELNKLSVDTSINTPSLSLLETAVDEMIKADLKSKVKEVEVQFKNIPETVTNGTRDVVKSSKTQLEEIKSQISKVTTELPLSGLNDVLSQLKQVQGNIDVYTPKVEDAEYIRGAGFSFLISWLFMIIVLILFLVGGNAYTLLCKTWRNGELLKFLDTPGVLPDFSASFGFNISISNLYRECEKNKPAWSVLHLNQKIDLDDLLNVSKYTDEIKKHFENADIKLSSVTFLSPEVRDKLISFSSKASDIDFTTPVQQINNISAINLNITAGRLDQLATAQTGLIKQELQNEAQTLREIQIEIETIIFPQLATVGEVLRSVGVAQDFSNKNATQIVKTKCDILVHFSLIWVRAGQLIEKSRWNRIVRLLIIPFVELAACSGHSPEFSKGCSSQMLRTDSFCLTLFRKNAFWFSLGWCMAFLIPSIILSIKLAKYYRRMKFTDVFE
ncbi:hypothetical protein WMY93_007235 [Mugilogobius chulae]|uniref:Uncharacterized protein n=1 Tax=Mugilogobius chulae TaxID=88201 RepID=A0AAW0PM84_9GOBI